LAFAEAFHVAHERIYGYSNRDAAIELVNARVGQSWAFPRFEFHPVTSAGGAAGAGSRPVYFPELGGFRRVPVYPREPLRQGARISGPAIIEQSDSTLVVYPGQKATLERSGNIIVMTS
jgi:N-methylhydantoinase A